jgi:hypothetical protein
MASGDLSTLATRAVTREDDPPPNTLQSRDAWCVGVSGLVGCGAAGVEATARGAGADDACGVALGEAGRDDVVRRAISLS